VFAVPLPSRNAYWIELAACENTVLALEPISRIVPTTRMRMTASMTAYSWLASFPDHAELVKYLSGTEYVLLHCARCNCEVAMKLDTERNIVEQWILPDAA
jgi:hypothetical protein